MNTQNKDTGQQPVRTPLVDRCGRTENSTENSRLDRLGNLDYALAPQDHPSRSATSPGTTLPARCHGDPFHSHPPDISIVPQRWMQSCERLASGHMTRPAERAFAGTECAFPSRRGAREVWGNPPPGCGALWRMAQLGKCARATPRQPAGRVARGPADLGLSLASRKGALCPTGGLRMRFSVTTRPQNASFREGPYAECAFP